MDARRLQEWWWRRQALAGGVESPGRALEQTGWARSVAGASPYLGLFARCGAGRETVDRAVADLELHELPAARGCTYVVPRRDFALALKAGQAFSGADMKTARKLGVTDAEVDRLCAAVIDALRNGPLDPEQLRGAAGDAVRTLGEEGRKKGLTTTLPLALGRLQAEGEIRRIPADGRLDRQRYRYALWRPNPLASFRLTQDEAYSELARRYFEWTAPATIAEFQWFSGLGVKAAGEAIAALGLEDLGDGLLMPASLREELDAFRPSSKPQYALVGSLDSILLLRRNLRSLLAGEDLERMAPGEKGPVALGGLSDLPSHAILDRGRVIGLWEFDTASGSIAWMTFARPGAALREAVARTERFVRDELGDARSFSLDSPKSRAPRVEGLRAMAAAM